MLLTTMAAATAGVSVPPILALDGRSEERNLLEKDRPEVGRLKEGERLVVRACARESAQEL